MNLFLRTGSSLTLVNNCLDSSPWKNDSFLLGLRFWMRIRK